MAEAKTIKNLRGYFDVKVYSTKPREQRPVKGNDEVITFGVKFQDKPEAFADYARPYTDKKGNEAYFVQFKVSNNCKWFDKNGRSVPRPDNTYLDGKQFEVMIQYAQLNGDAGKMEARGYWCNAIMYKEISENPFEGMSLEEEPVESKAEAYEAQEEAKSAPATVPAQAPVQEEDDLPF